MSSNFPSSKKGGSLQRRTPLQRKTPLQAKKPMSRGKPLERGTTPLKQGKPLQRKTPLNQGKPLQRGGPLEPGRAAPRPRETRLRPVSKKRQAIMPERRTLVRAVLAIQPQCVKPGCYADARDGHERKTRARGGSILSPTNVIGVCRFHNEELTKEPAWGYETGMLMHSWDEEPAEPCPVLSPVQRAAVIKMRDENWRPAGPSEVEEFNRQWLAEQIERGVA